MLQEVGYTDGGVQLPGLVRRLGTLAVVSGNVQKATVLCSRATVVLVYKRIARGNSSKVMAARYSNIAL